MAADKIKCKPQRPMGTNTTNKNNETKAIRANGDQWEPIKTNKSKWDPMPTNITNGNWLKQIQPLNKTN